MITQWELVDDADGIDVQISAEGRKRLDDEQRAQRQREEIRICTTGAALVAIAGLIGFKLLGM